MSKLSWLISLVALAPVASPEIIRGAIRDHPLYYCLTAVAFAFGGGLVVQYGLWLDGKITAKKASSELMFSVLTGVIAFLVLASRGYDELVLYLTGLLGGMAGKRTATIAHSIFLAVAKQSAAKWLGVSLPDDEDRQEDSPP